jgi:hypothetical protein
LEAYERTYCGNLLSRAPSDNENSANKDGKKVGNTRAGRPRKKKVDENGEPLVVLKKPKNKKVQGNEQEKENIIPADDDQSKSKFQRNKMPVNYLLNSSASNTAQITPQSKYN